MTMSQPRAHSFWFLLRKADDVPGEWVAHCLELDVVSQGRSVDHAAEMLFEATAMALVDDIEHGRDLSGRRAPEPFWDELWKVVREGEPFDATKLADLDDVGGLIAGQVVIHLLLHPTAARPGATVHPELDERPKLHALWSRTVGPDSGRHPHASCE
jgi:predicted RNase H-like HicB family nuclease